ncbi:hypothetical protein HUN08_01260 [Gordonia sp. X0973]|uniref:hypothetical protein n=1 Tax=Gordonia sp. X0973 TaxID=2742602 RepID=UPI000F537311|nr:hypothetical protein [Gordonia sp. X0973]QKT05969.1 hypothetical protein HUN08_01260 [Gordonia sp. X0973]
MVNKGLRALAAAVGSAAAAAIPLGAVTAHAASPQLTVTGGTTSFTGVFPNPMGGKCQLIYRNKNTKPGTAVFGPLASPGVGGETKFIVAVAEGRWQVSGWCEKANTQSAYQTVFVGPQYQLYTMLNNAGSSSLTPQ